MAWGQFNQSAIATRSLGKAWAKDGHHFMGGFVITQGCNQLTSRVQRVIFALGDQSFDKGFDPSPLGLGGGNFFGRN